MFVRFFSAALVLAVALPALAAEDVPLPPLTPKGEYLVMTQDDATSSSKCIGNPVTPMCAVETVMACLYRGNDELCRIGMGLDQNPGHGNKRPIPRVLYRVVTSGILMRSNFPWWSRRDALTRPGVPAVREGDVRIDILSRECDEEVSPTECHRPFAPITYVVRRLQDGWAVMTWGPAYDPRDRPDAGQGRL